MCAFASQRRIFGLRRTTKKAGRTVSVPLPSYFTRGPTIFADAIKSNILGLGLRHEVNVGVISSSYDHLNELIMADDDHDLGIHEKHNHLGCDILMRQENPSSGSRSSNTVETGSTFGSTTTINSDSVVDKKRRAAVKAPYKSAFFTPVTTSTEGLTEEASMPYTPHASSSCSPASWSGLQMTTSSWRFVLVAVVALWLAGPGVVEAREVPDPSGKILHGDLMNPARYDNRVKPTAIGRGQRLTVKIGLRLSQVLDVDEKNQVITTSVWLRQEWYDGRLTWDPSDYGGVRKLNIPSDDLWKPDLVLYNNADGDFEITMKTKATVYYTGRIVWEPPAIFKSMCPIDVEFFPFDVQRCWLKISSWTYNGEEVDLQHICKANGTIIGHSEKDGTLYPQNLYLRGVDMNLYYRNMEWDILNVTAQRSVKFYPCCAEPYPDVTFNITLRRRTLFYTLNLIMPCIAISCLTVLVFYLPSDSGEKITLSISILLALTVFFLLLSDMNPPTSLVIPLIGKYLLFVMIVVTASIFLTVYTLHINFKTPTTDEMSPWVKRIFTEILPRALLMKRPDMETGVVKEPIGGRDSPPPALQGSKAKGLEMGGAGEWGVYDSLRRERHESGESGRSASTHAQRFPPEVVDALKGVRFIANHLRQGDKDLAEERDWKYICMVIDRFFLYIFTTACAGGTLSIFLNAPSLYDPRDHLALVDKNSTCQY